MALKSENKIDISYKLFRFGDSYEEYCQKVGEQCYCPSSNPDATLN
ncbi:hypothetical protein AIN02nite_29630 [Acetobacter indonesiensis]|uniref:Uncharacterized protein n=1 Tax=Acetobacter indonesiensis TaxID=104101 RepID=A0A6N3T9T6_9PROT|nr:hypothetical protein Abin_158_001 [Acetobacter indonesiensis]GEN04938.1 hypothetical protein AIN02nite_29630 [Acetobacter indonesiensis]